MTGSPVTESIWSELSGDLRRFIRRRVPDDHLADDLLQETFIRIHRHIESLADTDRLSAWIFQIARNVTRDHFRKVAKKEPRSLEGLNPADASSDAAAQLRCQSAGWLVELIDHLPPVYRDAVRLSEIDELTQREVADRLGVSLSGVKSRIQRGRALLREALEQCCRFEFDRRGNLLDVDPRRDRACRECSE
jgi:RNA polymerase sigma-70 factor (ECF subfamily)